MANHRPLPLQEIPVEPRHIKSFLRCILHTILFHRSVKNTTPIEETIEELGVSYLRCDDQELYDLVEGRVAAFHVDPTKRTVIVKINERTQPTSWWSKGELKAFEVWIIQYRFARTPTTEAERVESNRELAANLRNLMISVVRIVNGNLARLLPLPAGYDGTFNPFPATIEVPEREGMRGIFSFFGGSDSEYEYS